MNKDQPTHGTTDARQFLRHTVATLAYRAEKVLRETPGGFPHMRLSHSSRAPIQILCHMSDLIDWAESMARGESRWQPEHAATWAEAADRFFDRMAALDQALTENLPESRSPEVIFQGPIADALTHLGQLALMRGLAGIPVRPESYARADIRIGVVGRDQPPPCAEFDGDASQPRPKLASGS